MCFLLRLCTTLHEGMHVLMKENEEDVYILFPASDFIRVKQHFALLWYEVQGLPRTCTSR